MDYDSDTSSAPSPSPPPSPEASFHGPPSLERLLQHFVAAKRSLGSTHYVWRANHLVTSSRSLLEEIAVLNAKNTFTRRGVDEQIDTLYAIRDGIVGAGDESGAEFTETIGSLDKANNRLQRTLESLRKMVVDASLQRTTKHEEHDAESQDGDVLNLDTRQEKKTLYQFIDEVKHTELQSSLRALIDSFNDARADFDDDIGKFSHSLKTISELLSDNPLSPGPADKPTIYDEPPPTIPQLFHGVESHATEMATLLQSLVAHYDLCVTALKHTEGGGEAAARAIQQADDELTKNASGIEASLYRKKVAETMSDEERSEMLRVLENDAQEVEDVIADIKDRNGEQESQHEQLSRHARKAWERNRVLREVLEMLHKMKDIHLPAHLHALRTFQSSWRTIQASIASQTAALASLSGYYDRFLYGYAQLLREVDRRKAAESQMRKVVHKANKELHRLGEADRNARQDFLDEVGDYLPGDIWPGIREEGVGWEVRSVVPE